MALARTPYPAFAADTLTASYVASDVINCRNADQIFLNVAYTMGAQETGNSIQIKVEFADPSPAHATPATSDWHQEASVVVDSGTATLTKMEYSYSAESAAGTADRFIIEIPGGHDSMKVFVKETGKASNFGTVTIDAVLVEQNSI